jgi:hypothetical protein
MATYSYGYEENLKRAIRDAVAIDPVAGIHQLTDMLSKRLNHTFDPRYIKKLRDKIVRQSLIDLDRTKVEQRMAFTRENYRMMREELLKIVYWSPETAPEGERKPAARDRIEAAKNVVMMDLAIFQAELANGLYKKPIDAIAKEFQYEPLPGEVRAVIVASWRRGSMVPADIIEQMVPLQLHAANGSTA